MVTPPSPTRHEQLESFFARIEPFIDIWPAIDVRYSAVLQEGAWRNLFTRVAFSWDRTRPAYMGELTLGNRFRAGRMTLQRNEGLAWLRNIGDGRVPLEDIEVRLDYVQTRSADRPTTKYGWTEFRSDQDGLLASLNVLERTGLLSYGLWGNGGVPWELLTAEEWHHVEDSLFQLQHPFGGLGEFTTAYLGFPEPKTLGHPTTFEIVAPFDTAFLAWSIKDGHLFDGRVTHPPTITAKDLRVAAVLTAVSGIDRLQCEVTIGSATRSDQLTTSSFSFPWKDYRSVSLHLMLRGHAVDTLPVVFPAPGSPNPRFQALFGLQRIGDLLAETLAQPAAIRESRRLEILVCWILHLCGFQTMPTDLREMTGGDVADIIAFDPYANEGLVVEVTARDPLSNEKLAKLRTRSDTIAKSVPSVTFHPIAVAVARDAFLPIEIEVAKSLSISLLSRSDLQRLFDHAQENRLPGSILREMIPGWG